MRYVHVRRVYVGGGVQPNPPPRIFFVLPCSMWKLKYRFSTFNVYQFRRFWWRNAYNRVKSQPRIGIFIFFFKVLLVILHSLLLCLHQEGKRCISIINKRIIYILLILCYIYVLYILYCIFIFIIWLWYMLNVCVLKIIMFSIESWRLI